MARLRWLENARTGDEGTVCTHDNKLFFDDTSAYIYASASATLDLVATTIAVTGDLTVSGTFAYGAIDIPTNQALMGTLTVGINDTGYDVLFYGAGSGKYWLWDEDADGVVLVGTFTETGNMAVTGSFTLTGAATISTTLAVTGAVTTVSTFTSGTADAGKDVLLYGAAGSGQWLWDANGDTNGSMIIVGTAHITGATTIIGALTTGVNDTGHDVQFYGAGTGKYWLWDEDADGVVLVGTFSQTGNISVTGNAQVTGTVTVGVNNTGHDVQFFGATDGNHLLWDESGDDLMLVGTATKLDVAGTTDSTSVTSGAVSIDGGLGVAKAVFIGGNISIATAKKITTTAELTLNSVDPLTIQIGGVDWLQMDEAAIATFAGATNTAGHAVYIESEDGGADGGAGTGRAGGAISLKTGDGSASATATAIGGAGGAFSIISGLGHNGNTTGNGGAGGAIAITAGEGGDSGAGAGDGGAGGTITLTAGAGGGAGGGTAGAVGSVTIGAGVLKMGVQTIGMNDTTVSLTLNPSTMAGTLLTGNILYVDAEGNTEILELPPEADCTGLMLVIVNTGGETITVSTDAGGAVLTLETANTAYLACDGTTWRGSVGVV